MTSLHLGALNGFTACVKQLLELGVDIRAADSLGRTPLHLSAYKGYVLPVRSPGGARLGALVLQRVSRDANISSLTVIRVI